MKAAVLHGAGDVRVEEVAPPPLQPGEVVVAIKVAITGARDLEAFESGSSAGIGHEFSGVITALGAGVTGWQIGDRVAAAGFAPCGECSLCLHEQESLCDAPVFIQGALAEAIQVPARIVETNLLRLKPDTAFADAALLDPLACVVQAVAESRLWPGDRLLVVGAGPIGRMFIALAHHLGCHITAAGRDPQRLASAKMRGAHHVVAIGEDGDLVTAIQASPSIGHGFDVVVDAAGRPEVWEASMALVRKGGLVNFFGACPAGSTITLDTGRLRRAGVTLKASYRHTPHSVGKALEFIERGVIRAADFVTAEASLEEVPTVLAGMAAAGRAVKTLVRP